MTDLSAITSSSQGDNSSLHPLPLTKAIWYFFIPSLLINLGLYTLFPWLQKHHFPENAGFLIVLVLPLMSLLVAALVAYRMEGRSFSWDSLQQRFRLYSLDSQEWLWVIVLLLFTFLCDFTLVFTSRWLAQFPLFTPPAFIPSIVDPRFEMTVPNTFLGFSLPGNWWILCLQGIVLFINVIGEELWWRGYILPRQELVHQQYTWIVHGILWTLFHSFWRWNLIRLLPTCLAYAYVAQKLKNTTPTIAAHAISNSLGLIPTILGILSI